MTDTTRRTMRTRSEPNIEPIPDGQVWCEGVGAVVYATDHEGCYDPHRWVLLGGDANEDRVEPTRMWINAMSCVRPTDEFAADVGRMVIRQAMESDLRDNLTGVARVALLRVVAS